MGQARRRKLAGNYPSADDAFAAARRFWCSRDNVAAEDFVAPVGTVAITIDVEGIAPTTLMFDATKVAEIEAKAKELAAGLSYRPAVGNFAKMFVDARKQQDDRELTAIGIGILWSAFNHPQSGDQMRRRVSAALRKDGKAHITWHFSLRHGLAISLGEGFVDLEQIIAKAPKDRVIVYAPPSTDTEQSH